MVFKIISHADIHLSLAHENLDADSLIQGSPQKKMRP
jgi:hypothetical protein